MNEVRRGDTWHVARTEQGVYLRVSESPHGVTIPTARAREILDALQEVLADAQ